jgi:hypothetical protein
MDAQRQVAANPRYCCLLDVPAGQGAASGQADIQATFMRGKALACTLLSARVRLSDDEGGDKCLSLAFFERPSAALG